MNYILFDDNTWHELLPLTFTRPAAEIRIGILTIREKWEKYLQATLSWNTQEYLAEKYAISLSDSNILINGTILPDNDLIESIHQLKEGEYLTSDNIVIAAKLSKEAIIKNWWQDVSDKKSITYTKNFFKVNHTYDIFLKNGEALNDDFKLLTAGRKSQPISKTVNVIGEENIFLEEGAKVEFATLNASEGCIYIGKDAQIMEGSLVRGAFAMCEHAELKLGAKVYGATTLGPYCKCGGELNNVVLFGYSSKAHDGFLGNAVLGEWCNLGADTNNSNLKNNYAEVKLWNYPKQRFAKTGLQFCGTIMGDHSKCGINTMLNTGTVIGVSSNVYGAGFPRNFIPSFSMGGQQGFVEYRLNKVFEVADLVMQRRNKKFDEVEQKILTHIFEQTKTYRQAF